MRSAGGPGRSRSGPLRVLGLVVAGLALVSAGVVALVRAVADDEPDARPASTIGRGVHVCVVVGTSGPDGGRFLIPLRRGLWKAHRELAIAGSVVAAHGKSAYASAIERFVTRGCRLTVMT